MCFISQTFFGGRVHRIVARPPVAHLRCGVRFNTDWFLLLTRSRRSLPQAQAPQHNVLVGALDHGLVPEVNALAAKHVVDKAVHLHALIRV